MEFSHRPVLLAECMEQLAIKPDGTYVDGTAGGGGHAAAICQALSTQGTLIGIDRDQDAIQAAGRKLQPYPCTKKLIHGNYREIRMILREAGAVAPQGVLFDLGVSSAQLDQGERGFSYMQDAPLDMRMDRRQTLHAGHVVNEYSQEQLSDIIRTYGGERWASRIAQYIVQERKERPVTTTGRLVEIIKAAIPASARRDGPHPAKRTFQAIRIEVNDELEGLRQAMEDVFDLLAPGGRFCVISFHSLEDRIVKESMQRHEHPCTCPPDLPVCVCGKKPDARRITRRPIVPQPAEVEENPRARSAKLRVAEKI